MEDGHLPLGAIERKSPKKRLGLISAHPFLGREVLRGDLPGERHDYIKRPQGHIIGGCPQGDSNPRYRLEGPMS